MYVNERWNMMKGENESMCERRAKILDEMSNNDCSGF